MLSTILVPLDGSPLAEQALPYAQALARRAGSKIVLVRAAQTTTLLDVDAADAQVGVISHAEHDLNAVAARLGAEGIAAEAHVSYDAPAPAILDLARRQQAGLIVMSTHGRSGLGRMVYGSVADDVLRHAEVPVLLVPATVDHPWPADRPLTILVPLDGSALAEEALSSAEIVAGLLGARLRLLRVVEPPTYPLYGDGYVYIPFDQDAEIADARAYVDGHAERLAAAGTEVESEVAVGAPSTVVARIAGEHRVDVIAMATHGRGGLARLVLGSVATGTLQRAHAPLLLTRPTALAQPQPRPRPDAAPDVDNTAIALRLSPEELSLIRQAVESFLLDTHRDDQRTGELRVILGRLRLAEQSSTSMETSAV
jgi:nucleotide-binding universal stress UspA family protein